MMKLILRVHGILCAEITDISITYTAERTFEFSSRKTFMDALMQGSNFLRTGMKNKVMYSHGLEMCQKQSKGLFLSVPPIILPCCFQACSQEAELTLPHARGTCPKGHLLHGPGKISCTYRHVAALY